MMMMIHILRKNYLIMGGQKKFSPNLLHTFIIKHKTSITVRLTEKIFNTTYAPKIKLIYLH